MRFAVASMSRVSLVIGTAAIAGGAAIAATADDTARSFDDHLGRTVAFLGASILLQLFTIKLAGRGSIGVSAIGLIAAGIVLGSGPAMVIGVAAALAQWVRSRGMAHRALFDAANFALSAGAAAVVYHAITEQTSSGIVQLLAAIAAGLTYVLVNNGLLCIAMGVAERRSPVDVWRSRFQWAMTHFLAFGPLALLAASAYASLGVAGLLPFVLAPVLLALSMKATLERARPLLE